MSLPNQNITKPLPLISTNPKVIHTICKFLKPFLFAPIFKNERIQEIKDKITFLGHIIVLEIKVCFDFFCLLFIQYDF